MKSWKKENFKEVVSKEENFKGDLTTISEEVHGLRWENIHFEATKPILITSWHLFGDQLLLISLVTTNKRKVT
jgi:hypothetical protein